MSGDWELDSGESKITLYCTGKDERLMVSVTSHFSTDGSVDARGVDEWLGMVARERGEEALEKLRKACDLAQGEQPGENGEASGGRSLKRGISVADILFRMGLDSATLIAAILHNAPLDVQSDKKMISQVFGPAVLRMVKDMLRIGSLPRITDPGLPARESASDSMNVEYLRRMLLSIADDIRVVLIVLSERLYQMRVLKHQPKSAQVALARETEEIYAPLANRLGIWQIKWELEDLCLRYLHNGEYREIAAKLSGRRADREHFIQSVIDRLQEEFARLGIKAEISGRPKHIYSIWKKMKRKSVALDQIFDLRAVRVLVDTVAECYAVLGVVHGIWRHIPGEFDDYIATPKANLYRSIHTAVIGPDDRPLEIQIRTHEMHAHAELGVAAHWRYKESGRQDSGFERRVMLIRNWLELKDDATVSDDFIETLKSELEPQHVYVLTPKGQVVELPLGATPVDFAYTIHTDVGNRCRGARVDGRIVPLTQPLESGKVVDILTTREGGPSRDWLSPHLGYIRTSKARNRIRQWFKQQDYQQHLDLGRTSLEREVTRLGVSRPNLEKAAARFNLHKSDDLLAAIGRGEVSPIQIAGLGAEQRRPPSEEEPPRRRRRKTAPRGSGSVVVEGVGDLMTHMARCCKPVPQDEVVGFITRGRGVTVHRSDCSVVGHLNEQDRSRIVEVSWAEQPAEASYPVDIRVLASDRKGLLRDLSSILTNEDIDVIGVSTQSNRKTDCANMRFTIEISSMRQLSRILEKMAQLPDVIEVHRDT